MIFFAEFINYLIILFYLLRTRSISAYLNINLFPEGFWERTLPRKIRIMVGQIVVAFLEKALAHILNVSHNMEY